MDGRTESRKDGRTDGMTKTIYPSTYFVCRGYKNLIKNFVVMSAVTKRADCIFYF